MCNTVYADLRVLVSLSLGFYLALVSEGKGGEIVDGC